MMIIKRFLSEVIPGQQKTTPRPIVNRKGEHTPEFFDTTFSHLLVQMQKNLGITFCPELMIGC